MSFTSNIYTFKSRTAISFLAASLVSVTGFFWPFIIDSHSDHRHQINQIFFYLAVPIALTLLISEISNERLDAKSVALLGVLAAFTSAVRPLGAGAIGIEPMWFILILGARVFGAAFGFVLGILSIFVSACLTGGFGPWLPYQMFAAGWIGLAAGALPNTFRGKLIRGRSEILLLVIFAILAALTFGFLLDLQFWPWAIGTKSQLSYHEGASVLSNLHRFTFFHFASSMAWDIPRAVLTSTLIIVTAPAILFALRRTKRKAAFLTPIEFREATVSISEHEMEQREV